LKLFQLTFVKATPRRNMICGVTAKITQNPVAASRSYQISLNCPVEVDYDKNQRAEAAMKFIFAAMVLLSTVCDAPADVINIEKLRVADSSDACFANCANQNASCKRVCPTTFNTPCLSACDSQLQICRQGCQLK
jgi:hypothetical protein